MRKLFTTYVNPILNYGSEVWNPTFKGQVDKIEKVQKRFYRGTNVKEESLKLIRLRKDLVTIHRMQSGKVDLKFSEFFKALDSNTRGAQNNNIVVQKVKKDIRKHSFAVRVVNNWNRIPKLIKLSGEKWFQKDIKEIFKQ